MEGRERTGRREEGGLDGMVAPPLPKQERMVARPPAGAVPCNETGGTQPRYRVLSTQYKVPTGLCLGPSLEQRDRGADALPLDPAH